MNFEQAALMSTLRTEGMQAPDPTGESTGIELARKLFEIHAERNDPFLYHTPESWSRKWLPSRKFKLMRLALNECCLPCLPRGQNLVLKKMYAKEADPIIVDYNHLRIGKTLNGFCPSVIVQDGKHRFLAAKLRGDTSIMAWVGERALQAIADGRQRQWAKQLQAEYKQAVKDGYQYRGDIEGVAPPGGEDMVKGLKKAGMDKASAYKIAWWHKNKYGGFGKKKES